MKKNVIIIIVTVILIILILSSLVVFAGNNKKEPSLQEKVSEEMKYMDKYLVSLLGDFENLTIGSYLKEKKSSNIKMESQQSTQSNTTDEVKDNKENKEQNQNNSGEKDNERSGILNNKENQNPEWNTIQKQIEELYSVWNTVSIDLHSLNVDGKLILSFSDFLNESTQNIKKKDKTKSMESVIKLYQLLPKYSQGFNPNIQETKVLEIQSNIVTSYVYASSEKWQEAQTQLTNASNQFASLLNSVEQQFNDQTTVNQSYILVNELIKAVKLKDKDIFFIQYQNLMDKMETI